MQCSGRGQMGNRRSVSERVTMKVSIEWRNDDVGGFRLKDEREELITQSHEQCEFFCQSSLFIINTETTVSLSHRERQTWRLGHHLQEHVDRPVQDKLLSGRVEGGSGLQRANVCAVPKLRLPIHAEQRLSEMKTAERGTKNDRGSGNMPEKANQQVRFTLPD